MKIAEILPNATLRVSPWCSFWLLEGPTYLVANVANEGTFSMRSHSLLGHARIPAGAHRKSAAWKVRAWAARTILALGLMAGAFGAAPALLGHASAGHATTHRPAAGVTSGTTGSVKSGTTIKRPWMW